MTHDYIRGESAPDSAAVLGPVANITGHWTAGTHDQTFDHYHFCVKGDGTVVQTRPTNGAGSLGAHAWHRNTGNVGVGICAMAPGCPITPEQVESTARLFAELRGVFGLDELAIKDHVYWAMLDGYGPGSGDPETRIDLTGTDEGKAIWGQIIAKHRWYRDQLAAKAIPNSLVGVIN